MPNADIATPDNTSQPLFRERVLPSVAAMLPLLLIFPSMYLMLLLISPEAGVLLGVSVTLAAVASIWFGAPVIQVSKTELSVGDAQLPLSVISRVSVIEPKDGFSERGVKLSPAAYTRFQVSVKTLVKIELSDPQDPTPYWLVSTRKPQELKAALEKN